MASVPATPSPSATLATLRGEAAALHLRAGQLEALTRRLEQQLAQTIKRGISERQAALALRQRVVETVSLLEETLRQRESVRVKIAELEGRSQGQGSAQEASLEAIALVAAEAAADVSAVVVEPQTEVPVPASPAEQMEAVRPNAPDAVVAPVHEPAVEVAVPESIEQVEPAKNTSQSSVEVDRQPVLAEPSESGANGTEATTEPEPVLVESSTRILVAEVRQPEAERTRQARPAVLEMLGRVFAPKHLVLAVLTAALVTLTALLTPLPELFGWQLFSVQSGSMAPAIPVGSIIAVRPVPSRELRVGDVITFSDRNRPETRVTHRIVALEARDGQQVAITKGDANNTTDSWNVPIDSAIGRMAFHVPFAGYLVYWLSTPAVRLVALGAVVVLLIYPALASRRKTKVGRRPSSDRAVAADTLADEIDALLKGIEEKPAQRQAGSHARV
ncbi:MAG TPA: signal peptidase I [Chloroflexota bacterium]|nr:signal peptidase I [Chloroflexota bacterium]